MSITLDDEIIFSRYSSDDIIQFKSREHYHICDYTDAKLVPAVDGRNVFQPRRAGKIYFGCSRHCLNGHKIEIKVRREKFKGFNKARGRPCDSNSGRGTKILRVSSFSNCQRQCRLSSVCNGYQFVKKRGRRHRSNNICTLYKGHPNASPISRVKPELLNQYKEYTCGTASSRLKM